MLAAGSARPVHAQIRAMPLNTARQLTPSKNASTLGRNYSYAPATLFEGVYPAAYVEDVAMIEPRPISGGKLRSRVLSLDRLPIENAGDGVAPATAATTNVRAAVVAAPDAVTLPADAVYGLPPDVADEPLVVTDGPLEGADGFYGAPMLADDWTWQIMPDGLIYRSYLASGRESRFGSQWIHERDHGWLWDIALGGRAGLLRYGTENNAWPEGWQLDIEGAAFPRLDLEHDRDLVSADFRFGVPLTVRRGIWEGKFSYYHLSSHLGDEYMARVDRDRINFVRDALVLGVAMWLFPDMRLYTEADWAMNYDGGAKPWEFQFGIDWSSPEPTDCFGGPFFAVNGHLFQQLDYGGNFTVENGWQWRAESGHLLRVGMQYFNGQSDQRQFLAEHEEQIGVGLWYDY